LLVGYAQVFLFFVCCISYAYKLVWTKFCWSAAEKPFLGPTYVAIIFKFAFFFENAKGCIDRIKGNFTSPKEEKYHTIQLNPKAI
jgi:hypothetical protein